MRWWRVIGTVLLGVAALAAGLALSAAAVAGRAAGVDREPLTGAELQAIAARVGPAVVRVEAEGCGGATVGSGFVVAGRVVTSGHLVRGATELRFEGDAVRGRAALARSLDPSDLAFTMPLADGPAIGAGLELAPGVPADGTAVVIVGGSGVGPRWLAAVARTIDGTVYGAAGPLLLLDRAVAPGWSGGPVVDRSGRVVGVVRAVDDVTGVTLAESVERLSVMGQEGQRDDSGQAASSSCMGDRSTG